MLENTFILRFENFAIFQRIIFMALDPILPSFKHFYHSCHWQQKPWSLISPSDCCVVSSWNGHMI